MKRIFFCFFTFALFPVFLNSAVNSATQHFNVPDDVSKQTSLPGDVQGYHTPSTSLADTKNKPGQANLLREPDRDPIEGFNRSMFAFNNVFVGYVLRPIAKGYSYVIPEYGRKRIASAADNVEMPDRLINCWLQARFKRSGIELSRFLINTTAGLGGLYDPAKSWFDLKPMANNFGDTFWYWGMGDGCYVVLPIQGSTSIRDGFGLIGDWFADPLTWLPPYNSIVRNMIITGSIKGGLKINDMSLIMADYVRLQESSADPYEAMKEYSRLMQKYEHYVIENDK